MGGGPGGNATGSSGTGTHLDAGTDASSAGGAKIDASAGGGGTGGARPEGGFDSPPPTNGTDDWPMFGHDAARSWVSTDALAPPLTQTAWSWSITSNPHMKAITNVISAGDNVYLHGVGDGPPDHVPGANNPYLQTLGFQSGMSVGTWSVENDFPAGDWYAATPNQVVVNDDALVLVDTRTFREKTAGDIDGICQIGDSDGEVAIDVAHNRFYSFNRGQYHDFAVVGPGFCIPEGNVAAYDLTSGKVLWSQNVIKYPVTSTAHLAYAAQVVYFSVVYDPTGNGMPAGTAPDNGVYALDAATGARKWLQKNPAGTTYGALSTDGRDVYVAAISGGTLQIAQLDAATGTPGWTSDSLGTTQSLGRTFEADPPSYLGGALFVYTGKSLTALDRASGKPIWNVPNLTGSVARDANHLAVSAASGVVYLTDAKGVRAFKVTDGSQAWSQDVTTIGKVGSLVLARGRAFVFGSTALTVMTP